MIQVKIEYSAVVITPTTGSNKIKQCIDSVFEQTHKNIQHLLVADGSESFYKLADNVPELNNKMVLTSTPFVTGANGFNGQRIYAAYPHLVNADFVFFCDEDNWFKPNHVESLIDCINSNGLDFAYSLREIYRPDGSFVDVDNCESLGQWPIWFTHDNPQYLVDTSSFAFKKDFIQKTCHLWHTGPWGEDRRYLYAVANQAKWATSGLHTLCYRLGGNPNSVSEDFFHQGNEEQHKRYEGKFPWVRP